MGSARAKELAERLTAAHAGLVETIERIGAEQWRTVPAAGVWSISKDVEHVIEAAGYHQWIVRRTIGDKVPARKPVLERARMTSSLSQADAIQALVCRTDEGLRLLRSLTDAQLDLETSPPRARGQRLATTIELVLIGHYDGHRADIESKLAARPIADRHAITDSAHRQGSV